MSEKSKEPTSADLLDAIVGLKDFVDIGFRELYRIGQKVDRLDTDVSVVKMDVAGLKNGVVRIDRRLLRIDDRLGLIENQTVAARLANHDGRITRLEGAQP